jgi:hypothetical protein
VDTLASPTAISLRNDTENEPGTLFTTLTSVVKLSRLWRAGTTPTTPPNPATDVVEAEAEGFAIATPATPPNESFITTADAVEVANSVEDVLLLEVVDVVVVEETADESLTIAPTDPPNELSPPIVIMAPADGAFDIKACATDPPNGTGTGVAESVVVTREPAGAVAVTITISVSVTIRVLRVELPEFAGVTAISFPNVVVVSVSATSPVGSVNPVELNVDVVPAVPTIVLISNNAVSSGTLSRLFTSR